MVAKFLYPATNRAPANMTEKKKRKKELLVDTYDLPVHDCTREQNSSPYFSSIVRQCKWLSLSRKMIDIHNSC